ncbi:MAG: hypothetical protein AAF217_14595 [Pseudomonadota bacterium]
MNQRVLKLLMLLALGAGLAGCVSDTLSNVDTQPQTLVQTEEVPRYDPVQRDQAVAEIRLKAEGSGNGELTNAFADPDGLNQPMTPQEQASGIQELENSAAQNSSSVSDAELVAKQRSIQELRGQAQSHYKNAVNSIQN